jgi:DNA-binding response OmpR family regulator
MDVLLIEGDARRRVSVAQYLARATHRVTISSSIEEAREILQFITRSSEAPDAVVIGENLLIADSTGLREEIADRFPKAVWVPLPPTLSLHWLGDWLQKAATRPARQNRKSTPRVSRILLIETDRAARAAIGAHFASRGTKLRICPSFKSARATIAQWAARGVTADFIVSPVAATDEDGITFFLDAKRRFPGARWIISDTDRTERPTSAQPVDGLERS